MPILEDNLDDWRPSCVICADWFSQENEYIDNPWIFDEQPEWRAGQEREGFIRMSTAELDRVYFTLPWHWKSFSRGSTSAHSLFPQALTDVSYTGR